MSSRAATVDPSQLELSLRAVLAHTLFPGRALLTVREVAAAWSVDDQHVTNMIECGDLLAIDLRTSRPARPAELKQQHKSIRQLLRIPTAEFDRITIARSSRL